MPADSLNERLLDRIRASWWLGPPPEALVLDWECQPYGVLTTRVAALAGAVLRLPTARGMSAAWADPSPPAQALMRTPVVELSRAHPESRAWLVIAEVDGGRLEEVDGIVPIVRPLPHPAFVAAACRRAIEREAAIRDLRLMALVSRIAR